MSRTTSQLVEDGLCLLQDQVNMLLESLVIVAMNVLSVHAGIETATRNRPYAVPPIVLKFVEFLQRMGPSPDEAKLAHLHRMAARMGSLGNELTRQSRTPTDGRKSAANRSAQPEVRRSKRLQVTK